MLRKLIGEYKKADMKRNLKKVKLTENETKRLEIEDLAIRECQNFVSGVYHLQEFQN